MHHLQYTLILLCGCFGLSVASPINVPALRRDQASVGPLLASVTTVTTSVANLDNIITGLTAGDTAGLSALVVNSNAVQQSLEAATSRVQSVQGILKTADANQLRDQVEPLVATTQVTITDLVAKKAVIAAAGVAGPTLNALQSQKTAALNFANALQVKVPSSKQKTAAGLASDVVGAFDNGIAVFSAAAAAAPAAPQPPATPSSPATPPLGSTAPAAPSALGSAASTSGKKKNQKAQRSGRSSYSPRSSYRPR